MVAAIGLTGLGSDRIVSGTLYGFLLAGATAVVGARAVVRSEDRAGWLSIALGLALWTAGHLVELWYGDASPELAGLLPVGFFVASFVGVRQLGAQPASESLFSLGIVVSLLGLATVWSTLVFGPVFPGADGSLRAVTDAAYPVLEFALASLILLALARNDWRLDASLLALALGVAALLVSDTLYGIPTLLGHEQTGLGGASQTPWPAAAALIGVAAWLPRPPRPRAEGTGDGVALLLTLASLAVAVVILVWDHFQRLTDGTVLLAGATMAVAMVNLVHVHRGRSAARREAETTAQRAESTIDAALDCIFTVDAEGRILDWNPAAELVSGYSREEVLGRRFHELSPPSERAEQRRTFERLRAGDPRIVGRRMKTRARHRDGRKVDVEVTLVPLGGNPQAFTVFARDITERRRSEQSNSQLAAVVNSTEDAVISSSVDGRIVSWNPAAERLFGYSAEEAIGAQMVPDLLWPQEIPHAQAVQRALRDGRSVDLEATFTRRDGSPVDVAMRAFQLRDPDGQMIGLSAIIRDITDRRMREEREAREREERLWRERVLSALHDGRMEMFAQPIVNLASGQVVQHELLMRLRGAGGEVVSPDAFLPYIEDSPVMASIDRWAVRVAIEHARTHRVAVNLSANSLDDAGLLLMIEATVGELSVDPQLLTFEITETAAAENLPAARALVERLTALGCRVALDDFGTGFGSFTYLKHLSVSELKVDVEFTRDLIDDPNDRRVVRSIISVAEAFDLLTVAEGVESREVFETLTGMGVNLAQGYLFSPPLPLAQAGLEPPGEEAAVRVDEPRSKEDPDASP